MMFTLFHQQFFIGRLATRLTGYRSARTANFFAFVVGVYGIGFVALLGGAK